MDRESGEEPLNPWDGEGSSFYFDEVLRCDRATSDEISSFFMHHLRGTGPTLQEKFGDRPELLAKIRAAFWLEEEEEASEKGSGDHA